MTWVKSKKAKEEKRERASERGRKSLGAKCCKFLCSLLLYLHTHTHSHTDVWFALDAVCVQSITPSPPLPPTVLPLIIAFMCARVRRVFVCLLLLLRTSAPKHKHAQIALYVCVCVWHELPHCLVHVILCVSQVDSIIAENEVRCNCCNFITSVCDALQIAAITSFAGKSNCVVRMPLRSEFSETTNALKAREGERKALVSVRDDFCIWRAPHIFHRISPNCFSLIERCACPVCKYSTRPSRIYI